MYVVFLETVGHVGVSSCGGTTTRLPDAVSSSSMVGVKGTEIDSILNESAEKRATLNHRRVRYKNFYVNS